MKTLLILRHAKSSWKHAELPDFDRPLNKRGKRDAPRMGELLRQADLLPDLVLSSSAQRARQTTQAVVDSSGYGGEVRWMDSLYAAPPESYLEALRALDDSLQRVMLVGHNPSISDFLAKIIAKSGCEAVIEFKKGAVARVETGRREATLNWFFTPKIARAIQAAAANAAKSQPKTSRR